MAGGFGRTTVPEHAGQVPTLDRHNSKEQHHNTLRYSEGTQSQKARYDCQVPPTDNITKLRKDKKC